MIEKPVRDTPTVVIIYGACVDPARWRQVISNLVSNDRKFNAVAVITAFAPEDGSSATAFGDRTNMPRLHQSHARDLGPFLDHLLEAGGQEPQPVRSMAQPVSSVPTPVFIEPLTAREHEVLHVLAEGASNQQIAQALVIAPNTVKRHVQTILAKLGVRNRTQAVARAQRLDLLPQKQAEAH